jgi:hypothetical protein
VRDFFLATIKWVFPIVIFFLPCLKMRMKHKICFYFFNNWLIKSKEKKRNIPKITTFLD